MPMRGKTVLVTGSTDGIGQQTALHLAQTGAHVLIHGRNAARAEGTCMAIRDATGNPHVDALIADLSSQRQVRALADQIRNRYGRLHVLINNAGVFMNERVLTEDGFEMTFGVNHLAPFLLTNLLLETLLRSAPARVICVSSVAHQRGRLDFDNLQGERVFTGYDAYARSKLANVLFTIALADRLGDCGITANCLHPGVVTTKLLHQGFGITGATVEQGAGTSIYLATAPELDEVSGLYFVDRRASPPAAIAGDRALRERLWDVSAHLTGLDSRSSAV